MRSGGAARPWRPPSQPFRSASAATRAAWRISHAARLGGSRTRRGSARLGAQIVSGRSKRETTLGARALKALTARPAARLKSSLSALVAWAHSVGTSRPQGAARPSRVRFLSFVDKHGRVLRFLVGAPPNARRFESAASVSIERRASPAVFLRKLGQRADRARQPLPISRSARRVRMRRERTRA